ncbi:MAG: hypothetical protein ABI641_16400 [Caldimonas sp.]
MSSHVVGRPASSVARRQPWSTASFPGAADTSPMELGALGAHVRRCNGLRGRLFAVHCAADSLVGFLAPRLTTTVVVTALVFGIGSLLL